MNAKMKRTLHIFFKIFIIFMLGTLGLNIVLLVLLNINHKSKLKDEAEYLIAPGQFVEVDGCSIHTLVGGDEKSDKTLVFLHSGEIVDDSIALQPLMGKLENCRFVYIDRSGYGFSDHGATDKDIESILKETRGALDALGIEGPYTLVAMGTAGIEAFYWASVYPDEVEEIIGINIHYPEQFAEMTTADYCGIFEYIMVRFCKIGGHRVLKSVFPSDDYGVFSSSQMKTRGAIVGKYAYTEGRYAEESATVDNAHIVAGFGIPKKVPIYLIYNNPLMEPFVNEDSEAKEVYEDAVEKNPEVDYAKVYNDDFREYFAECKNVVVDEMSGPDRLYIYAPEKLAEIINNHIK